MLKKVYALIKKKNKISQWGQKNVINSKGKQDYFTDPLPDICSCFKHKQTFSA